MSREDKVIKSTGSFQLGESVYQLAICRLVSKDGKGNLL